MDMTVNQADAEITRVDLDGRFDIQGAEEVDARFGELAESSKAMIVDLSKVTFIASLGIRTLMLSAKTLIRPGGRYGGLRRQRKRRKGPEGNRLQ
jgi:anti-anti-sigma factor